jgi:choline dehydrogenase-like flavoprotein
LADQNSFCTAAYEVGGKPSTLVDAYSGDHMGFFSSLAAVDRTNDKGRRSYAATGYLRPNLGRPNLKVLTEALATKVTLDGDTATGVEFQHGGQNYSVKASKEVILSGGVINSPQLLELSGIGDPEVLNAAGVDCKIENKRVGAGPRARWNALRSQRRCHFLGRYAWRRICESGSGAV